MTTWNYRIIRHKQPEPWYGLHEVFYDDGGAPISYTADPITFTCDEEEGPEGIVKSLTGAVEDARRRPVLDEDKIGGEGAGEIEEAQSLMKRHTWTWVVFCAVVLTLILWAVSMYFLPDAYRSQAQKVIAIFWALGPPAWFLWEWHKYTGPTNGPKFEAFKLNQERAKDFWLGVGVALAIWFKFG